jgi:hypothetical protein
MILGMAVEPDRLLIYNAADVVPKHLQQRSRGLGPNVQFRSVRSAGEQGAPFGLGRSLTLEDTKCLRGELAIGRNTAAKA